MSLNRPTQPPNIFLPIIDDESIQYYPHTFEHVIKADYDLNTQRVSLHDFLTHILKIDPVMNEARRPFLQQLSNDGNLRSFWKSYLKSDVLDDATLSTFCNLCNLIISLGSKGEIFDDTTFPLEFVTRKQHPIRHSSPFARLCTPEIMVRIAQEEDVYDWEGFSSWDPVLLAVQVHKSSSLLSPPTYAIPAVAPVKYPGRRIASSSATRDLLSPVKLKPRERLLGACQELICKSGKRNHALGMYIENEGLELWYFDRRGALFSNTINLAKEDGIIKFISILLALRKSTSETLGFFPFLSNPYKPVLKCWNVSLKRLFHSFRGLTGPGTAVFEARLRDSSDHEDLRGNKLVVRLSWHDPEHLSPELGLKVYDTRELLRLTNTARALVLGECAELILIAQLLRSFTPLTKVPGGLSLLTSTFSAMKASQYVLRNAGIFHGDVSPNKILVNCNRGTTSGLLTDFDLGGWPKVPDDHEAAGAATMNLAPNAAQSTTC